jgi:predicted nucleotidyltransferase component of viral defense system
MIQAGEIQQIARKRAVRDTQIEKDYVIGWILKGISQNVFLSQNLTFKGGTVLKKVWFDHYRYSEDLDFTYQGATWDEAKLEAELLKVCEWVFEESRISLNLQSEEGTDEQYKCYINYRGPLGGEKNIKCDISKGEELYFERAIRPIIDDYSDAEGSFSIVSYSLEEVLAEKLRCTIQRTIPRDIYDVWFLTNEANLDIEEVAFGYRAKTEAKGFDPMKILESLKNKEARFKGGWEKSLSHQINDLPEFDGVWRDLMRNVKKMLLLLES